MESNKGRERLLAMNLAKRLTTEEFIKRAKEIYGDRFDYSKTEYVNARVKLTITCKEHGDFTILPQGHLKNEGSGRTGCSECGKKAINKDRRLTQEQFLERVKDIEGISFEKSVYKDKRSKIVVTCKIHGDYTTTAEVLLKGYGCKKCASERLRVARTHSLEQFINKAKKIHRGSYDYSEVEYKDSHEEVKIRCNTCNRYFYQTPATHLKNSGCSYCKLSKGEIKVDRILEDNKIFFVRQKTFKDLVNIRPLKFDFFLPWHNACIEFDGIQHFKVIEHWGSDRKLELSQINDNLKDMYCEINNISLLRIRYDDENVEETIKKFLLSIKSKVL